MDGADYDGWVSDAFGADPGHYSRAGAPLPYREATEMAECTRLLGEGSEAECRGEVLGERPEPPEPAPPPPLATHSAAGISAPVPDGATTTPDGSQHAAIAGINVTIRQDARSSPTLAQGAAETHVEAAFTRAHWRTDSHHRITSFTPMSVSFTIWTEYGPNTNPTDRSGYGRGTTPADVAAGNTSLQFHESRHATDYEAALNTQTLPPFTGQVGQTEQDFSAAVTGWQAAITAYVRAMRHTSEAASDCTGSPNIDQFNSSHGTVTSVCPAPPPAARRSAHKLSGRE